MNRWRRFRTRFVLVTIGLLAVTMAFGAGYRLASRMRLRPAVVLASGVPPTDFAIPLPEGSTRITITDPQIDNAELVTFTVQREGNSFKGVPELERTIEPRTHLSLEDISFFRRELSSITQISEGPWQRANRIRNWLFSSRYKISMPGLATRVPREAYLEMRQGKPVLCGNLAEIYVAFCESAGLIARSVGLSLMVRDGTFGTDTHAGAEIWIPEMGGWIYQDPTFNCYWTIDGRPASALQLHNALMGGREIQPVAANARARALLENYYVDPRLLFRHISYEYKPGGPLLYYVDGRIEPLNMRDRNWLQSDESKVFEGLDQNGNRFVEHKGEVAPGIFAQLIGNVLFIRDRRDQNRGIRVRSSSSTVQVCSYEHWRAEELGIFQGKNLVRNGSFDVTGRSEGVAADWIVSGPVEVVTMLGGQGMAAQAGGRLSQRIVVEPGKRYLMYAKISVARGMLNWSLADSARGMESHGMVRPTQMTEIVSDIVESRSGYLDVSFELPEAGGFRVMNVIVTELSGNVIEHMQKTIPTIESAAK
ncbi:MAG TPA: transglutaminase-like domain-containing protein [Pyrinomonadaceae bacterium]|nr:transglutaminase-like domain-containing protein [Pyrinomonadaceae bacterium]